MPDFFQRAGTEPQLIRDGFDCLARQSLIRFDGEHWTIHRLTAQFWRARLDEDAVRWADAAARLVNGEIPGGSFDNPVNWNTYRRLQPHARALLPYTETSLAAGRVFNRVACFACARGVAKQDLDFAKASVNIYERLEPTGERLTAALNNLAEMQKALGEYDVALDALERAREISEHLPEIGLRHPEYAIKLNNIAGVHRARKAFGRAEPLFLEALNIARAALGPDNPSTVRYLANLAVFYGEWAEASEGIEQAARLKKSYEYSQAALAATRRVHGEWDTRTARCLNNESLRRWNRGQTDEAVNHMRRAVALRVDILGSDHPLTKASLEYLLAWVPGEEQLRNLRDVAAECRATHRQWGNDTLNELFQRRGITIDVEVDALLNTLMKEVLAERDKLQSEGAPTQKWEWVEEEYASALQAVTLNLEPRKDFYGQLRRGIEMIRHHAEAAQEA